jgi:hypothetical protein
MLPWLSTILFPNIPSQEFDLAKQVGLLEQNSNRWEGFPEGATKCRNCEKYGILENILNAGEFVNVRV